ncbi:hypothetical protein A9Q84_12745 [Halobacteriovorax marinus]|uniref:DOMON-like domain-containing protein n=1 Tax=Halobacteriovorax marinus TaxID=97084 RepID=A0A1Y5F8G2_9BACT|nr:hypothetical protein A9Q84_12745 [Halobacteriovorax marinus]
MKKYHFNLIPFKKSLNSFDIQASLELVGSNLEIEFIVKGNIKNLHLPKSLDETKRVIGLWESSCFECFILNNETLSYYEFNYSPEGHWNCFYFPKPKAPLKQSPNFEEATCVINLTDQTFSLKTTIDLYNFLPGFWKKEAMSFGLTSVIECDEKLSYWAISHIDEKPNFHNFESFERVVLE